MLANEKKSLRIIALRNEKGSYNLNIAMGEIFKIIALRNEKGSYNLFTL